MMNVENVTETKNLGSADILGPPMKSS